MKYNVSINGKKYEVEVERADTTGSGNPAGETAEKTVGPQTAPAGSGTVHAPMPGTIVDIKVSSCEQIQKGQVLIILEAMKMENEIVADRNGVVESIAVVKGASVNTNDALLTLK